MSERSSTRATTTPPGDAEARALGLLHEAAGPAGFVAALDDAPHYRRVWTRDGSVASLAAVMSGDGTLIEAAARTLDTVAAHAGPGGEIPSNVGQDGDVSYGGLAGRLDSAFWYALAVGRVAPTLGDPGFARRHGQVVERVFDLAGAWELNRRGLIPVPLGGDWADEYLGSGYLLGVQVLRLIALRTAPLPDGSAGPDARRAAAAEALARRLELDYWPDPARVDEPGHYHPVAFREVVSGSPPGHWLAGFDAAGYPSRFDALANALAVLADLGGERTTASAAAVMRTHAAGGLVPAFAPVVEPGDPDWRLLRANRRAALRNEPGAYHNGGRWPWITGLWAAALAAVDHAGATDLADAIDRANARGDDGTPGGWRFHEFEHARTGLPGGVARVAWSAAGAVIARRALAGRPLLDPDPARGPVSDGIGHEALPPMA